MQFSNLWSIIGPIIITLIAGGILALLGVSLGGFLVFKTKRTPDESLFRVTQPKGEAYNLEDLDEEKPFSPQEVKEMDEFTQKHGERFDEQLAVNLEIK